MTMPLPGAVARALLQLEGFAVVGEAADALSAWTRSGGCDRMWWWCSTSSFPTLTVLRSPAGWDGPRTRR
jgi:hypothetical protein